MARASETQKAERLNRARDLLLRVDQLSDAVGQLARDCSISARQAYRYLEQAQRLKEPVPSSEAKLAFTVKLPLSLVRRVRTYAAARTRAWVSRNQFGNVPCSWNIDSIGYWQTSSFTCTSCSCRRGVSQSEERLRKQQIQFRE